ncbi:hypothetical protein [Sclerotinia sclerotiorum reovirus 1]|nr:hypothetical protein [Sclerotinia sclerotiorum reovirus 1]
MGGAHSTLTNNFYGNNNTNSTKTAQTPTVSSELKSNVSMGKGFNPVLYLESVNQYSLLFSHDVVNITPDYFMALDVTLQEIDLIDATSDVFSLFSSVDDFVKKADKYIGKVAIGVQTLDQIRKTATHVATVGKKVSVAVDLPDTATSMEKATRGLKNLLYGTFSIMKDAHKTALLNANSNPIANLKDITRRDNLTSSLEEQSLVDSTSDAYDSMNAINGLQKVLLGHIQQNNVPWQPTTGSEALLTGRIAAGMGDLINLMNDLIRAMHALDSRYHEASADIGSVTHRIGSTVGIPTMDHINQGLLSIKGPQSDGALANLSIAGNDNGIRFTHNLESNDVPTPNAFAGIVDQIAHSRTNHGAIIARKESIIHTLDNLHLGYILSAPKDIKNSAWKMPAVMYTTSILDSFESVNIDHDAFAFDNFGFPIDPWVSNAAIAATHSFEAFDYTSITRANRYAQKLHVVGAIPQAFKVMEYVYGQNGGCDHIVSVNIQLDLNVYQRRASTYKFFSPISGEVDIKSQKKLGDADIDLFFGILFFGLDDVDDTPVFLPVMNSHVSTTPAKMQQQVVKVVASGSYTGRFTVPVSRFKRGGLKKTKFGVDADFMFVTCSHTKDVLLSNHSLNATLSFKTGHAQVQPLSVDKYLVVNMKRVVNFPVIWYISSIDANSRTTESPRDITKIWSTMTSFLAPHLSQIATIVSKVTFMPVKKSILLRILRECDAKVPGTDTPVTDVRTVSKWLEYAVRSMRGWLYYSEANPFSTLSFSPKSTRLGSTISTRNVRWYLASTILVMVVNILPMVSYSEDAENEEQNRARFIYTVMEMEHDLLLHASVV